MYEVVLRKESPRTFWLAKGKFIHRTFQFQCTFYQQDIKLLTLTSKKKKKKQKTKNNLHF